MAKGTLRIRVEKGDRERPIENAKIIVRQATSEGTREVEQQLVSDSSGLTQIIELEAPDIAYSQSPSTFKPYSTCDITVTAEGYQSIIINGTQIFPGVLALQDIQMKSLESDRQQGEEVISIPEPVLYGNYPEKIPEDPVKPLPKPTGGVVLQSPVVPQYIVVHLGPPDDDKAENLTVRFIDYIKNVCSSEIYATWPESSLRANIFVITSFVLNRIYTEWYRGQGKNFQITNSTAFDQAFFKGRNIFENISKLVDLFFSTYVIRAGQKQPLLTQFCDGVKVVRPGWLYQWGSKDLAEKGLNSLEILREYYGSDISLQRAEKVIGIPQSYPGYTLGIGNTGQPVRTVQTFLNRIAANYPALPKIAVSGNYDVNTATMVRKFQEVFNLQPTGVVDYSTWYAISRIYVAVTKIAELRDYKIEFSEGIFIPPIIDEFQGYVPTINYPIM